VVNSLKLLSTAAFAALLLGQRYSTAKWLALAVLALGVSLAQRDPPRTASSPAAAAAAVVDTTERNATLGYLAICFSCVTSGLAGCWFERVLKVGPGPRSPTPTGPAAAPSLWQRNLQLAAPSFVFSLAAVFVDPSARAIVLSDGFFRGYDSFAFGVIVLHALGGILVALVVREASAVIKGFATSLAIIGNFLFLNSVKTGAKAPLTLNSFETVSSLFSSTFWGTSLGPTFITGATLVVIATFVFGLAP
jgi:UDP-sugar transporter A1/2/3